MSSQALTLGEVTALTWPHILPRENATPIEIALDLGLEAPVLDIPVPLRELWNPDACPPHLLDHLAWGLGVDLWDTAWSDGRKRRMCREAWRLKRLKGKLPGVAGYLSFVDARIVAARIPPQKIFARSADPARQTRFLARFAQLRVYPFRHREAAPGLQTYASGSQFAGGATTFVRANTASARYGRRATIWDRGLETEVRWSLQAAQRDRSSQEATPVERIVVPAREIGTEQIVGRSIFVGRAVAASSRPRSRIITIDPVRQWDAGGGSSISPSVDGLAVVTKRPQRVKEQGAIPAKAMRVGQAVGGFVSQNNAALRLYDRYHMLDADRLPRQIATGLGPFVGSMRVSIDPFCAHFRISHPGRERGRTMYVGGCVGGAVRPSSKRMDTVAKALRASALYRDTLKFTTRCHEPLGFRHAPQFADAPAFGDIVSSKRAA